jgi:hypothetical protein
MFDDARHFMTESKRDIACEIPPWLKMADEALTLYGRWAMDRRGPRRCGSAEGRYQPERGEALEARREAREIIMPTPDALAVHRALLVVPQRERWVLMVLYVPQRIPAHVQLRIAHIPPNMSRERHRAGLQLFDASYKRLAKAKRPD